MRDDVFIMNICFLQKTSIFLSVVKITDSGRNLGGYSFRNVWTGHSLSGRLFPYMKLGNGGNRYPKFKLGDEVFLFSGGFFRFGRLDRFFGIHGAFEHGDCRDDEDAGDDPFDGVQRQRGDQEQADGNADTAE